MEFDKYWTNLELPRIRVIKKSELLEENEDKIIFPSDQEDEEIPSSSEKASSTSTTQTSTSTTTSTTTTTMEPVGVTRDHDIFNGIV